MNLDSARDLKAELRGVLDCQPLGRMTVSSYGLRAGPVATLEPRLATFALGLVACKPGDYRLAVRLQRRGIESSPHVDLVRERARGEVDIRYVGRVVKRQSPWQRSRQRPIGFANSGGLVFVDEPSEQVLAA